MTLALITFLICLAVATTMFYLQTAHWVRDQQYENMRRVQQQLDLLFGHVERSAQSLQPLIGMPCTAVTVAALRKWLAITPNVGNIELTISGNVYCSSLSGVVPPGWERREALRLYLTTGIRTLPGHPFVIFHLQRGDNGLYTSTDGYYIRSVLDAASGLAPIVITTAQGWMAQDGIVHTLPYTRKENALIHSNAYGYQLITYVGKREVIAISLKSGRMMMGSILILAAFMAFASYLWSGRSLAPEKLLQFAIKNREFHPYYQPIVKGDPLKPVGCEVLVRWLHQGKIIPPDQFIPLAEQTGLIIPITCQLIRDVTDHFVTSYPFQKPFYISLNIGAHHLQSDTLETDLDYLLTRAEDHIRLVLEITEREIIVGDSRIKRNIDRLKARGVRFALDDFGTGSSTLETLHFTPVELIKIDKLFTAGIGSNELCHAIIANITDLAKRVNADLIAEGVETKEQVAYLRQQDEMAFQGYLFSRPLPLDSFKKWLKAAGV